ncbi:MAG: hypothetical protein A2521_10385 [Deltaproteobacteria bacterium RIFOXYD12_FULL_57_12]|nr:MAG: hypothetical protein A2521_10385 [Deltaproteobacteria bacterium RIFOXYD12_FULL_57_12]
MEIEIQLETGNENSPEQDLVIDRRLREWHADGAEIRYDKVCLGGLTVLEEARRYRVDLRNFDPLTAIRELHARLYRFGVKVFVHFLP